MLSHLTNAELLRHIDAKRYRSPLIDELASRLETATDPFADVNECPVCGATITIDVDTDESFVESVK